MRAYIYRQFRRLGYEIILVDDGRGQTRQSALGIDDDGNIVYGPAVVGAEIPVFIRLRDEELQALAKAFLEEAHPEDATIEALKDTRAIRDRLLALIEARWK
jgi:hypothetical protein